MSEENKNEKNEINENNIENEITNETGKTSIKEPEQATATPKCEQTVNESEAQTSQSNASSNGSPNFNPYAYYNPYAYPPFPYGNPNLTEPKPKKKKGDAK